jgi:peptide/nickel transport system substrate-binding protein
MLLRLLGLLLSLSLLAPACGTRDQTRDCDTLTVLIEAAPKNIDPRFALDTQGVKVWRLIFAGLTRVGSDVSMQPDVAERWEVRDGGQTYVFHLRPDVVFHDGRPLTSADVVFTYRSILDPGVGSPFLGVFRDRIRTVEAEGPHRVLFRLQGPVGTFLADVSLGIVPAHLGSDLATFVRHPVGAGPFALVSWREGEQVTLRAHPGYHLGRPRLKHLVIRTVRNEVTRYLELVGGKADLVQNGLSPLYLQVVEKNSDLQVISAPSILTTYLAFNLRDPALGHLLVRQAIAHAIDREVLIRHKFQGRARLATGLLAPIHWAYTPTPPVPHDPQRARELLDLAGFNDPDGPGPLPRLRLTYKTSTDKFRLSVARVIASQLAQVGIEVDLRPYEWGTFFEDLKRGNFQLATLQWAELEDPDILHWIFHSRRIPGEGQSGANRGAYVNPEVDRLLDLGQRTVLPEVRKQIYGDLQRILARDLPYVFLWHEDNIAVARREVRNLALMPNAKFDLLRLVSKEAP